MKYEEFLVDCLRSYNKNAQELIDNVDPELGALMKKHKILRRGKVPVLSNLLYKCRKRRFLRDVIRLHDG